MSFIVGLDLGQIQDYTAVAVIEQQVYIPPLGGWVSETALTGQLLELWDKSPQTRDLWEDAAPTPPPVYCRHLARWPLGTSYPTIVRDVIALVQTPPLKGCSILVPDATGVGQPVIDMLLHYAGVSMLPVTITGGATATGTHVPKRDLISATQVLLQSGRLKIARSLPDAAILEAELANYRVKVTENLHETFNAREGEHDDLVLALALACWFYVHTHPIAA